MNLQHQTIVVDYRFILIRIITFTIGYGNRRNEECQGSENKNNEPFVSMKSL